MLESPPVQFPQADRILPDGCTEIVIHLGDAFHRYQPNDLSERQPNALFVGQMRSHVLLGPSGRVEVFGIRFWPGGAYPFFGVPQHEFTDQIVDLDSIWGWLAAEFRGRIHDAETMDERVNQAEAILASRLHKTKQTDNSALTAAALILEAKGNLSIDSLADKCGIGFRRLDRIFNARVGFSPKTLCRIIRFQRALKLMASGASELALLRIALDTGYYDQSHFIKDFREFAGKEPTSYVAEQNPISDQFIAGS